jgi:hypothetical protein
VDVARASPVVLDVAAVVTAVVPEVVAAMARLAVAVDVAAVAALAATATPPPGPRRKSGEDLH